MELKQNLIYLNSGNKMDIVKFKATGALLGAMILWSTSFVALKSTFEVYPPAFVIFGRLFIAAFIFLFLLKRLSAGNIYRKGDLKYLILMALFEPCFYFVFESMALTCTTSSQAGMITSMLPLLVGLGAFFVLKEKISYKTVAGFIIAAAGASALSLYSDVSDSAPNPILGNFLEFIAMIFATAYTITLKKLSVRYNPFFLTAVQTFTGTAFFLPGLFLDLPGCGVPQSFELSPVLLIIYMGVFISLGAYGLFNYGISKVKASRGAAFTNLLPVFSVFWGWLILGEGMNSTQYIASAFVIFGVYLSQINSDEEEAAAIDEIISEHQF